MNHERTDFRPCLVLFAVVFVLSAVPAGFAWSQSDLIIYPSKGQSQEQKQQDEGACYSWAKQQSGFDPMAMPTATSPPPASQTPVGGVGKGAVGGGLLGLAVGAIAGDAGKGAAIGAVSGGVIGGVRRHDQTAREEQSRQQWEQQEASRYAQGRSHYNRAFGACMEGRGYTVR
jgi:hypothetical protein